MLPLFIFSDGFVAFFANYFAVSWPCFPLAWREVGVKGASPTVARREETPGRQEQLPAPSQLPRPRLELSRPPQNKAPHCAGETGRKAWRGGQSRAGRVFRQEPGTHGLAEGSPTACAAPAAADPLSRRLRASPGARPWRWVRPGCRRQLMSSQPGFSRMPPYFFFLSHVMAWASRVFLPPSSLGRRSLQMPASNAAACWKGAPKIGWRDLCLAGLRGSWKHVFLLRHRRDTALSLGRALLDAGGPARLCHVPGAGTGAAGSDVPRGRSRAAELPQPPQRAKYFITLFSSHVVSRVSPAQPAGPRGKPARVSAAGSRGVLSLVCYRSKAYATRCASVHLAARLLCFPCSSPINILTRQPRRVSPGGERGRAAGGAAPSTVSVAGYGMDEAEQDQYEARLKELFDSFDSTGTGSLGQEELTDLCHMLHLEEVAPALQQTLLQGNLLGRVHFDQFKEALILILSRTLSNEEHFQEADSSPEAQPKYIKGGKRYGRRSLPEFQESVEDFAEVTVIEPLSEEAHPPHIASSDREEHWKTRDSEEYEAEGQLRFWNPDDLNASPGASLPTPDWIEEKLQEVCEHLGITRDGHLNRKKLISICEQHGLRVAAGEVLEEVLHNLEQDGTMSVEDFFYGLFKNGKSLTPSASTPYRQLKRHLSMQSFDESGRRTTTPSAMPSTVGFCLFSSLDDGMGYGCAEGILDCWHQEGIENSQEILKALDFGLDGKVNLTELTLALENELLITKNGVHQAALASFKTEIRHLLERVDQVAREKEKLRSDLEKAEKLKSLMASEVDDHHAAIERRNEYNLRKLDEEYKERIAALKNELRREREQILQQANKQRLELEQEIEKLKTDENYIRDRLALSLKENSRLESELLETGEKLAEYESLASKLQRNLENVLAEKFGDLDPSSAEFFLQEERLAQMRSEYERQCRELQDQIDELHSELEEYRAQGKVLRPSLKNSLSEEFDIDMKSHGNSGIEPDQGLGSEDCNPLNMSIEAEMAIEQMKEQHHRDLHHLKQELEDTVSHYEKQLDETKIHCEKEQEDMRKKYTEEMHVMEKQITGLKNQIAELQGEAALLREQQEQLDCKHNDEKNKLKMSFDEEKANLQELLRQEHEEDVRARLEQVNEKFRQEREELIQNGVWVEEKMRVLVQTLQEEKGELERGFREQLKRMAEVHALEKDELQQELLRKHEQDLEEERCEAEKLREENAILKNEVTLLNEDGSASSLKLRELNGSREEMWQKIEAVRKEKVAVQKMVDNLKKQVADLKTRNQQLDSENTELSQRNSKNQADVQDLNQQLARVLKQKEREAGKCTLEEWEKERLVLKEELENSKVKSSNMVSSLEMELSKMKIQAHILEQENHILKQELEKTKQLPRCPDLSDLQNEVSSLITKNEKLQKEKEALSEELNRCIDKVAKVSCLENAIGSLKQEQKSWEQQSQTLKTQLAVSQEKVQSLDETLQNTNLQMSRLKSDLRVTQQEKETLKQEVVSLHKQLQNANEKNRVLERAVPSSGLQDQQRQLHWDELEQLMKQEQQLLRQENERLQREVQSSKTDVTHSREKIRQLEATILSLKHQKHQSQSGIVKAIEQEKLSLKRECEQLQKELSSANRKISQMNSLERELETSSENEGLRKKQVKLDDQLMEMLHSSASVMLSQPPHSRELQQQGCAVVPKEQFLQLQHQLLQAERRSQRLQEELESRPSETNMQQGGHEQLLKMMEERMMDVEQKLRLVKRLLQDKVNQLKEQLSKNTKADAMVKDLYVENAQLLKALEMTEQRQKTAERKNYLLEEKIANLNRIVKNLASPSFNSASEIRS